MKKKYILICLLIAILTAPYIKAEVLTLRYGKEFELNSLNMVQDISYCKVLKYDKQCAEVIYVCKGRLSVLVTYQKSEAWEVERWDCIWSRSGSADSLRWLLYR